MDPTPLADIPTAHSISVVFAVTALAAYAVTWLAKSFCGVSGGRWHWRLRALSLTSGALAGLTLGGWPWGAIVGLGGGSFTTSIVAFVRNRLSGKIFK